MRSTSRIKSSCITGREIRVPGAPELARIILEETDMKDYQGNELKNGLKGTRMRRKGKCTGVMNVQEAAGRDRRRPIGTRELQI